MVLLSVLTLFVVIFSVLIVPGIVGIFFILYGLYLIIKGNKTDCIESLKTGLILLLIGIIAFIAFGFDVRLEIERSNHQLIEEYNI